MRHSIPKPNPNAECDKSKKALRKLHKGKRIKNLNASETKELLLLLALQAGIVDADGNITEN